MIVVFTNLSQEGYSNRINPLAVRVAPAKVVPLQNSGATTLAGAAPVMESTELLREKLLLQI